MLSGSVHLHDSDLALLRIDDRFGEVFDLIVLISLLGGLGHRDRSERLTGD
jgi:hypothetical protein